MKRALGRLMMVLALLMGLGAVVNCGGGGGDDGSGGSYQVRSEQAFAEGVGSIFRTVSDIDRDSGPTGQVWEVSLTRYTVHGENAGPITTTLQHPLFPSTLWDTWTSEWRDTKTGQVVDTESEMVTAVNGNSLTITDDTGHERYYEIKKDAEGRIYVVITGETDSSFDPPVVVIPPDLNPGATYKGGGYQLTITGLGSSICTSYTVQTVRDPGLTVPAGTFDAFRFIRVDSWLD